MKYDIHLVSISWTPLHLNSSIRDRVLSTTSPVKGISIPPSHILHSILAYLLISPSNRICFFKVVDSEHSHVHARCTKFWKYSLIPQNHVLIRRSRHDQSHTVCRSLYLVSNSHLCPWIRRIISAYIDTATPECGYIVISRILIVQILWLHNVVLTTIVLYKVSLIIHWGYGFLTQLVFAMELWT